MPRQSAYVRALQKLVRITRILIATAVLVTNQYSYGTPQVRFSHHSVEDGLSQNSVQAIVQDQNGFIWFGTQQGLNRFDGYTFKSYFADPTSDSGLASDWIWTVFVDADGVVWIGTKDGGLARMTDDRFETVNFQDAPHSLSVRAIAQGAPNQLWVGTDGGGLSRLNVTTGEYLHFQHDPLVPSSLSHNRVKAIHVDRAGRIWVGTDGGGLNLFAPETMSFTHIDLGLSSRARIRALASDEEALWVGTYEDGLVRYTPQTGVYEHIRASTQPKALSSNSIRTLLVDSEGVLWVGHDSRGVDRYLGDGKFASFRHQPANRHSVAGDHVASLLQDASGVLWVGTVQGVSRWNTRAAAFTNYNQSSGDARLTQNWVSSFAQHDDFKFWVGTAGGGINLVDLQRQTVEAFRHQPGEANSLSDDRVFALAADKHNNALWVGTRASGIAKYDLESGTWEHYRADPNNATSLSANGVTSLHIDPSNRLWVGTYSGGLNLFDLTNNTITRLRREDGHDLCWQRILSITADRSQAIWVGTDGGGACRIDPKTLSVTHFNHSEEIKTSLSSNNAWVTTEDAAGNLWIGTADAGINIWTSADRAAKNPVFQRLSVDDGLASPVVYGLVADDAGFVWVSSNRGLAKARFESPSNTLQVRHFSSADGLQGNEFNFAAALRATDGRLLFGGTQGFTTFQPAEVSSGTFRPKVALTAVSGADGKSWPLDALGAATIDYTNPVITFEYAAMDFSSPSQNRFEHTLEGFDSDWVDDGTRRRTTYTNLAPGRYTFRVRARNAEGRWSEQPLSIPLTVLPPPWRTMWAYAIYFLTAALIAFLAYRAWHRRIAVAQHIQQVNQSLVAEIADREEKETALRAERARAQMYLDVVEVIMLALDEHGRVTMVNPKGLRVLGASIEDTIGRQFCDSFVPADQQDQVRARLRSTESYTYAEWRLRTRVGGDRLIAWHTIALPENNGEPRGILLSGTDVTQVRSLEEQLRDAQKMEALGTLARGVAHDFNNILSAILGYTELSQNDIERDHPAQDHLRRIGSSVTRARDLVQRILTFGRVASLHPRTVAMTEVIHEALQLVTPILPREVRLRTELDEDCGTVLADPSQLIQIILNLCTNASQSMTGSGGELLVALTNCYVDTDTAQRLGLTRSGSFARLRVSDTGPGMDDYTLSRIFEPFFTTRQQGEGTGLGLAVVHGIVGQLKGAISVSSNTQAGTRFDIYLPHLQGDNKALIGGITVTTDSPEGEETLLFVDDEAAIVAIAERALTHLGYQVIGCKSGAQALERFDERGNAIDVVITDQSMPGMSGEDLARAIKERSPQTLVVLVSGADHPQGPHIDAFVSKPFTTEQLGQTIRRLIRSKHAA